MIKKSGNDFAAFMKKAVKREMNALSETTDKKRPKQEANNYEEDDDLSLSKMSFNEFAENTGDDDSINTDVSV